MVVNAKMVVKPIAQIVVEQTALMIAQKLVLKLVKIPVQISALILVKD